MRFGREGNGAGRFKDNRHVVGDGKARIYSSASSPMPVGRIFVAKTSSIKILDTGGQKLTDLKAYQAFGLTFNSEGEMLLASRPYVVKYRIDLGQ